MRFEGFRQNALVSSLGWPDDVVEQFLYDHADNIGFLRDYGDLDLTKIEWDVEVIPVEELIEVPTGASDGDCIEDFAANPDHLRCGCGCVIAESTLVSLNAGKRMEHGSAGRS